MTSSLCFWTHNALETKDRSGAVSNETEASMCTFIASWLAWNSDHAGKDVSVLALYKGVNTSSIIPFISFFFFFQVVMRKCRASEPDQK